MTGLDISPDLQLPLAYITSTGGILAKKRAGKSNAAVRMAEAMYDAGVPWVAIDPKGDWWGMRSSADGTKAGLPIVVFGGRHADVPLEPSAGAYLADLVLAERLTCVIDVSEFSKADVVRFLIAFGDRLYRQADTDPIHLFLEEAHEYLPQRVMRDEARLVSVWQRIVKQGGFKGLGVTLISQRSASLNKDVLTQVDTLFVLRTTSPQDRAAVRAWVDSSEVPPELIDSLPRLTDGEAWVWSPEFLGVTQRIRFHRRRTFDSGATPEVGKPRKAPATLADVDLAAIKEAMADTIEKAKADDPKELRKQISSLKSDVAALRRELEQRPGAEPEVVEVIPSFVPEMVRTLKASTMEVHELVASLARDCGDAIIRLQQAERDQPSAPRVRAAVSRPTSAARPQPSRPPAPRPAAPAGGDLPKGEGRILIAVAQYVDGVTREQLTVLTGYKRSSRDTYLQRLKERGLITTTGGTIVATDAGVDALGDDFEPLPTGRALREHWFSVLPAGEARILEELVAAYPDSVSRDELSERTGYKRSSRDTYLQRLRSRQLVTTDGDPRAADVLFQEVTDQC